MPAIHVRGLVPAGGRAQVDEALAAIALDVASAIDGEPSGTWCTFVVVDRMSIGTRVLGGEDRIVYLDLWIRSRAPRRTGPP